MPFSTEKLLTTQSNTCIHLIIFIHTSFTKKDFVLKNIFHIKIEFDNHIV